MNKEWSEMNHKMQNLLKREDSFIEGINQLMILRNQLIHELDQILIELNQEDFCMMPYINIKGYHSKSIAYSIWHIFRIEDIVSNTLISNTNQIFFKENYQSRINTPIITTGNELVGQQIFDFSKQLNINELYKYIHEVKENTDQFLLSLEFKDLKKRFDIVDINRIQALNVVSKQNEAIWLIDYWCSKDIKGLIQMPFSRHWIMHIEACLRIKKKLR